MKFTDAEMLRRFNRLYAQMDETKRRQTDQTLADIIYNMRTRFPQEPFGIVSAQILFIGLNDILWLEESTIKQLKRQAEYELDHTR